MTRLALRRGSVVSVDAAGPVTSLTVDVAGEARPAIAYVDLTGPVEAGDEVVVNVAALDLGLGSGGFDIVHANLTRGLDVSADPAAHAMKLGYTSLQHGVSPAEDALGADLGAAAGKPVAVIALHGQLAPVAWAAAQQAPEAQIGYVQTWGGALPGALSDTVRELRGRGLLACHVTAASAFGGEQETISVIGAIHAGLAGGWDAAIVGPGPGMLGSATLLGHGGMAALESAHAALALGCEPVIVVPRMSSGDARDRHRGLSHHTATVLELLLRPVVVALPEGEEPAIGGGHTPIGASADLDGYRASGLPATTMGRGIDDDPLFFRAALAGGAVLGHELHAIRADRR